MTSRASCFLLAVGLAGSLTACADSKDPVMQSLQPLLAMMRAQPAPPLKPNYRYLRVVIDGRTVFLALGNLDGTEAEKTEVWYSADRAVLRLRDGRVAGALGMTTEWRRVEQPDAPTWREAANAAGSLQWLRVRDVMPGYHVGVRDAMSLMPIDPPARSALEGVSPVSLTWFEETVAGRVLPPARYAVDLTGSPATVIYAEQCLSAKLCFSWQRWAANLPARKQP